MLIRDSCATLLVTLTLCACGEVRYEQDAGSDAAPADTQVNDGITIDVSRTDLPGPVGCGDKICGTGENANNCPADCPAKCGDKICSPGEDVKSCPADCVAVCGDSICSTGENAGNCPADCQVTCGDKICSTGENNANCPADCSATCGDSSCSGIETAGNCPKDCPAKCPDGFCTHTESAKTCASDCPAICGDAACTHNENAGNCPKDCPVTCGDSFCTHTETAANCPQDCPAKCGDLLCSPLENAASCPADCPAVCGDGHCTHSETATNCFQDCKKLVNIQPTADTYLRQIDPLTNYSSASYLTAGSGNVVNGARRALLRFDLAAAGCAVQTAVLNLYLYDQVATTSPTLSVHAVTAPWVGSQVSWTNHKAGAAWSSSGGDRAAAPTASLKITTASWGWKQWDITTLAKQWATTPSNNHGLMIREANDHTAGSGRKFFRSQNSGYTAQRPTLQLTCSP